MSVISVGNKETAMRIAPRLTSVKEIVGYTHYLLMQGQLAGNLILDGHKPSAEELMIAKQARSLADSIQRNLRDCCADEIAELFECYDMSYRMGYERVPDEDFIGRQKLRIFSAWKSGKGQVEESVIFDISGTEVRYRREKAGAGYLNAYQRIKEKWLFTLLRDNCFADATTYENYQRLALMMRENFSGTINNVEAAKRKWYEHNKVEDLTTLSTQILRSYRRFASALFPSIMGYEEQLELDNRILAELTTRADLDPYDREAFRLALKFNHKIRVA